MAGRERVGLARVRDDQGRAPVALAWVDARLLVLDEAGELCAIDPVGDVRTIRRGLDACEALAVDAEGRRYLAVGSSGRWTVGTLDGAVLFEGTHPFRSALGASFADGFVVLTGDDVDGQRSAVVLDGAQSVWVEQIPAHAEVYYQGGNTWVLLRSLPSGLEQVHTFPSGGPTVPSGGAVSTRHRLRVVGSHVLGTGPDGVCVWDLATSTPRSMRLGGAVAADLSLRHGLIAIGTQTGVCAVARFDDPRDRALPSLYRVFEAPLRCVAFAPTRPWLALGAETLQLWRYPSG